MSWERCTQQPRFSKVCSCAPHPRHPLVHHTTKRVKDTVAVEDVSDEGAELSTVVCVRVGWRGVATEAGGVQMMCCEGCLFGALQG